MAASQKGWFFVRLTTGTDVVSAVLRIDLGISEAGRPRV